MLSIMPREFIPFLADESILSLAFFKRDKKAERSEISR
jgi:hypothetical protein